MKSCTTADRTNGTWERLWECSLQDLIAICLPYMIITAASAVVVCFLYDPTMDILLYSGLPDGYKNWFTFWVCMIEEIRLITMVIGTVTPVWQLQVIAFDLANDTLKEVEKSLSR